MMIELAGLNRTERVFLIMNRSYLLGGNNQTEILSNY